ncbi:MAG: N-acetylmuramoyl-L-alanine amidase [Caldilineales bacterium]|nr:N-acetylmuramoyl-L-alanine amidase [Caldilineales bacterium]
MRDDLLEGMQTWLRRLLLLAIVLAIAIAGFGVWRGSLTPGRTVRALAQLTSLPGLPKTTIALVAGHRGSDSGATCANGLTELAITTRVADLTSERLREENVAVLVLDEYDRRLEDLDVKALVSIHADSCVELTGFKVASGTETVIPDEDEHLVRCIETQYGAITGLKIHPTTVTDNMTGYHAFQRVADTTPGAIIELGFMGGDQGLLTEHQERMADGVAAGIMCFLDGQPKDEAATNPESGE